MSDHPHPHDPDGVGQARATGLGAPEAQRLADLVALLADPVRLRVLFALVATDELCVGDVATALDISDDQSTYALRLLRAAGLVEARREGRLAYHRLADSFPHDLLDHCLRQLLTITERH